MRFFNVKTLASLGRKMFDWVVGSNRSLTMANRMVLLRKSDRR